MSDSRVYEPYIRALLGTASHLCEVVVLKLGIRANPVDGAQRVADGDGGIRVEGVPLEAPCFGKGNSNSHGARPVHQIISMIKWIRTSRLSMKNSLSLGVVAAADGDAAHALRIL